MPDKLPACPVLVEAGEAEKAGYLLKDRFTNKGTYKACRCRVEKRVQKLYLISTRPQSTTEGLEWEGLAIYFEQRALTRC